jgi:hypothetical protein
LDFRGGGRRSKLRERTERGVVREREKKVFEIEFYLVLVITNSSFAKKKKKS